LDGLSNAKAKLSFTHLCTEKERVNAFTQQVELIANKQVLGTDVNPACWHLPFNTLKNVIGSITLDNNRTRGLVNQLSDLIDLCEVDENRWETFKQSMNYYNTMFVLLCKKEEFSDDDIDEFRRSADYIYSD
jgi:hypothetical protein